MMTPIPPIEIAKAVTDLLIAVACVIAIIPLSRICRTATREEKLWLQEFVYLALASVLGYFAHNSALDGTLHRLLWAVLYAVMFELDRIFALLILPLFDKSLPGQKSSRILVVTEIVLYLLTAGIRLATGFNTIGIFALFGVIVFVQIIRDAVKHKDKIPSFLVRDTVLILALLGAALLCQIFTGDTFYVLSLPCNGVVIAHILLALSVIPLYSLAKASILTLEK